MGADYSLNMLQFETRIIVFLAAATQMLLVQFTTLSNADIQLVGLLLDPRPLSRANTWIWRSVVIRGGLFVCLHLILAATE